MTDTSLATLIRRAGRMLLRAPTYARDSGALRTILKHSTPRRLANLLMVEAEYRLRRTRLVGRPYVLVADPTNVCNLRCPLCSTGLMQRGRQAEMMSWETYTRVIDTMAPWAYKVNLFNWGEPLLHSHIFDMIRYASEKNLGTSMSSNMSIALSDESIDGLINSGLEFICLSIDGATQETYATYRRRGDLELVLSNVRRLVTRRRELGSRTPALEWQFIPMKHNEHEIDAARAIAKEIGVDQFRVIPVGIPFDSPNPQELRNAWFPTSVSDGRLDTGDEIASNGQSTSACYFLYRYLVVNPDGKTSPCCVVSGEKNDFGKIDGRDFKALWNNAMYRSGRAQFATGGKVETATVCDRCDLFVKRAHLPEPRRGRTIHLKQEPNGADSPPAAS